MLAEQTAGQTLRNAEIHPPSLSTFAFPIPPKRLFSEVLELSMCMSFRDSQVILKKTDL